MAFSFGGFFYSYDYFLLLPFHLADFSTLTKKFITAFYLVDFSTLTIFFVMAFSFDGFFYSNKFFYCGLFIWQIFLHLRMF